MYESRCAQEKILIHLQIRKIRGLIKGLLCTVDGGTDLEVVRGGAVLESGLYKSILLSGTCIPASHGCLVSWVGIKCRKVQ